MFFLLICWYFSIYIIKRHYCLQAVEMDTGHTEVAKMMERWTNQIGYPVITINTTNGEIYQKQFLFNDTAESEYVLNVQQLRCFSFTLIR